MSTDTFDLPTPDDTDLVKDGAQAIRHLAGAIDTLLAGALLPVSRRGGRSSSSNIGHNSDTKVWPSGAPDHDLGGIEQVSGEFVVPVPGLYLVQGGLEWDGNDTGWRRATLRHRPVAGGGSYSIATSTFDVQSSIAHAQTVATVWEAAAGDAFYLRGRQNSGSGLSVLATPQTFLAVTRLPGSAL